MDRLVSFGTIRSIDSESRTVEVTASTGDVARDGMMIDAKGWQLDNYNANPVVLWAHDLASLPIAKATSTKRNGSDLVQTHVFADHARAEEVFQAVRGGFVNAVSVRWIPLETTNRKVAGVDTVVFTRNELLEVSYVPIPSDPKALVKRADGGDVDVSQFAQPEPEAPAPQAVPAVARMNYAEHIRSTTKQLQEARRG